LSRVAMLGAAALALTVSLAAAACTGCGKGRNNPVVMTIDGKNVSTADLLKFSDASTRNEVALGALRRALVEREVAKLGIKVSQADVESVIEADKKAVGGDEAYQSLLASNGRSMQDAMDEIRLMIMQQRIATRDVEMTESQIRDWYQKNPTSFGKPAEAQFWLLQAKTKQQAEAAITKVKGGADFKTVAQQDSSEQIMEYGDSASWRQLPAPGTDPLVDAIIAAKPGEMTPPVQVQWSPDATTRYRVAYVVDKKEASLPAFEEVRAKAEFLAKLSDPNAENPDQLMQRLMLEHQIEVPNPDYAALDQMVNSVKQRKAGAGSEGITIPQEAPPPGEGGGPPDEGSAAGGSAGGTEGTTSGGTAQGSS